MKVSLKSWARSLKTQTIALYLAARDPRTPFFAKVIAWFVVAYALSPIDLIPDFIPVLGYLDDAVIVPVGICIVLRLIPEKIMEDARLRAKTLEAADKPKCYPAAVAIVLIWLAVATIFIHWCYQQKIWKLM